MRSDDPLANPLSGVTSLRSIFSTSADRSEPAEANSFAASFAQLLFEPQIAMPSNDAATAAAIMAGSKRIAPKSIAASKSVSQPHPSRSFLTDERDRAGILAARGPRLVRTILTANFETALPAALNEPRPQIPHIAEVSRTTTRGSSIRA